MPTIRGCIKLLSPPQFKKMSMPLRGLRDLQFTVNYFNQIKGPLLLGVQLFSTWGMEVFPWRVGW